MPIYTKRGDQGETGFLDGKRVKKSSLTPRALGALDELNSFLGVVFSFTDNPEARRVVREIQTDLFGLCSIIAGARLTFSPAKIRKLEKQIDNWEKILPPLKNFVYPAGSRAGSLLFFARTLARRAERTLVALSQTKKISPQILKYSNRLSDFLFVFARYLNFLQGAKEEIWKK